MNFLLSFGVRSTAWFCMCLSLSCFAGAVFSLQLCFFRPSVVVCFLSVGIPVSRGLCGRVRLAMIGFECVFWCSVKVQRVCFLVSVLVQSVCVSSIWFGGFCMILWASITGVYGVDVANYLYSMLILHYLQLSFGSTHG